jgi:N-formylglutamate amidohydrolase
MIGQAYRIPGVLVRHDPIGAEVPLVFDSPHSGTEYPDDFRFACPLSLLRRAEDSFVDELYGAAPASGATLLAALFPRSYIDPNRAPDDIDTSLLSDPWPGPAAPGDKTRLGLGLVWRLARPDTPIYERKLSSHELQQRLGRYYDRYHAALGDRLDHLHARFGSVWHIDCHSMPSEGGGLSADDPGARRADFVLGDRDGTTCDGAFTAFVAEALTGRGYGVRVNDPYKGVELVRRYGRPAERRQSLQIEINRRLYMNEETLQRSAGFAALKASLNFLIDRLAGFARSQPS